MKLQQNKIYLYIIYLLIIGTMVSCQTESIVPSKGSLKFSWNSSTRGGRVNNSPSPSAILIGIHDANGNDIEQNRKLTLYKLGNSFISESLELPVGSYALIQFAVLDSANNVIYATPIEGSDLAQYVNDPLPIEFSVTENGSTLVTPQVIPVSDNDSPEDFGFVSFGFDIVSNSISYKVKNWLQYTYREDCACFIPSSLTVFSYSNGQLSNIDSYANYTIANGFRHNYHSEIEYHPDSSYYRNSTWLVHDDVADKLIGIQKYFLNEQDQVKKMIYYSLQSGEPEVYFTDDYVYLSWGYTIQRTIFPSNSVITKSEYLISGKNLQTARHFGYTGNLVEEVQYAYNSTMNPLYNVSPFLQEDYKSKNNISEKITSYGVTEVFNYQYDSQGRVIEVMSTSSVDGPKSRTVYQYY